MLKNLFSLTIVFSLATAALHGQENAPILQGASLPELAPFVAQESRVAIETPATTFPMPITSLRYEPIVDVQERNFAESQGDVSIRGGIFENTGFRLGAATLYDPQTGHYFAEIPVTPQMLTAPTIYTGADNALYGFNSTVGTVSWDWQPIREGASITAGVGNNNLNHQQLYGGFVSEGPHGWQVGLDGEFARSEADGSIPFGDHDFNRYGGRIQVRGGAFQTDLYAGYQSKFFGWPELYAAPFGSNETENLQTTLFFANHQVNYGGGDYVQLSAYYRRHKDHYVFNRNAPNNNFVHETQAYSVAMEGLHQSNLWDIDLRYSGQFVTDDITSTNLTAGPFNKRDYYKVAFVPEKTFALEDERSLTARLGFSFDDTNEDGSALSPIAELALLEKLGDGRSNRYYISYAKTTQVPGYTAIKAAGGLFAGNQGLGRERSDNYEIGIDLRREAWTLHAAAFFRQDEDLADWTFQFGPPPNFRTANAVNIDTYGLELVATHTWGNVDLVGGYTFLHKDEDYGNTAADASFYALNYAKHRLTAAIVARLTDHLELRADNEFRVQEDNPLREGTRTPVLTSAGAFLTVPQVEGLTTSLTVDNLWNTRYQEVPGTPGSGRQITLSATKTF